MAKNAFTAKTFAAWSFRAGHFTETGTFVIPTTPGEEWTLPVNRPHWTMPINRMHWTLPANRPHWTLPEDE